MPAAKPDDDASMKAALSTNTGTPTLRLAHKIDRRVERCDAYDETK